MSTNARPKDKNWLCCLFLQFLFRILLEKKNLALTTLNFALTLILASLKRYFFGAKSEKSESIQSESKD
jgi:hypothetical protein